MSTEVVIFYHSETEGWWADSPQIPGWTGLGDNLQILRALTREAVTEIVGPQAVLVEMLPTSYATTDGGDPGRPCAAVTIDTMAFTYAPSSIPRLKNSPLRSAPSNGTGSFEESAA